MRDSVDVLILHGKSTSLVSFIRDVLISLGISANTVLDLPSQRKTQEQRVEHYIRNCKIALVVMTFNEEDPDSNQARPNVYDEIARCQRLKKKSTIVLQERRGATLVEIPSNVRGQLILIEFEQSKMHLMLPNLFTEIRSRGLPSFQSPAEKKSEAAHILNRFLDEMDDLWDLEFDEAWDNVHRKDPHAERNFAIQLDLFFQQYQTVFSALIRKRKVGEELIAVCNDAFNEAHKLAARAWEIVAEAKMQQADAATNDEVRKNRVRVTLDRVATIIKNAKRMTDPADKISSFRSAVKLLLSV